MKAQPERLFVFRLARELGMTVSRLLAEADSSEIADWMAYFRVEDHLKEKKADLDLMAKFRGTAPEKKKNAGK